MRRLLPIAAAALLLSPACAAAPVAAPELRAVTPTVEGAKRIMPSALFAAAFFEMENCTGRRGDFRRLAWFVVDTNGEKSIPCSGGGRCAGRYISRDHAIYLADHYVADWRAVTHEIIHALGIIDHPPSVFPVCAPRFL